MTRPYTENLTRSQLQRETAEWAPSELSQHDNPRIREWEALMWQFQAPTPWTPDGAKWTAMQSIFRLRDAVPGAP